MGEALYALSHSAEFVVSETRHVIEETQSLGSGAFSCRYVCLTQKPHA